MGGKINGNLTESGGLIAIFSSKLVLAFHDETLAFSAGLSRTAKGGREAVSSLTNQLKMQKRSPWNVRADLRLFCQ